jgi:hypothetical protein
LSVFNADETLSNSNEPGPLLIMHSCGFFPATVEKHGGIAEGPTAKKVPFKSPMLLLEKSFTGHNPSRRSPMENHDKNISCVFLLSIFAAIQLVGCSESSENNKAGTGDFPSFSGSGGSGGADGQAGRE